MALRSNNPIAKVLIVCLLTLHGPTLYGQWVDDVDSLTTMSERVGIGTTAPGAFLVVTGSDSTWTAEIYNKLYDATGYGLYVETRYNVAANYVARFTTNSGFQEVMAIKGDGNVGIGTTNPFERLHVNGNIRSGADGYIFLGGTDVYLRDASGNLNGAANSSINLEYDKDNGGTDFFQIKSGPDEVFKITNGGNVGIGTISPSSELDVIGTIEATKIQIGTVTIPTNYHLAVDGKIIAEEVKVENSGSWPDYVFADDYNLMPIEQVEAYIASNGHLPDVPTSEEVAANGLNLGEGQALLLKKIEELTLYMIDLKKQNDNLQAAVENLSGND